MNIVFNDKEPIYTQIINYIKKSIVSGELQGGEKLVSVRELSQNFKVNPNTIQRAYTELEREELAFTKRGMGKYVTEDKEIIKKLKKNMAKNILNNFIIEMKELGFESKDIIEIVSEKIGEEV
ncbi:GntR family transcriptional regulator [Clostridium grantii]|uniref:DNA-binding transcriptional regulator YhcF, GntR family n=1 Tax=Clostridium grantii DSM 8605 TaxID=1121316 RepID=A0A1M5U3G7_9CLOT|nr:GntR family transcriptional regulator [Clostridium grantii]SHH57645.1 DNA-binding transcriptional regulator YhcF, GntR family [Clostridium grantii DSM 8605]